MKKILIKAMSVMLLASMASCGNDFLEVDLPNGLDTETALTTPSNVGNALNGAYYQLFRYYFAGNYATTIGDLSSDITYWNGDNAHQDASYRMAYTDTYYGFGYIWEYGYKVVDNATRVINACDKMLQDASEADAEELKLYQAEAYALRAYANTQMALVFCHQPKVDGKDFSDRLGLVIFDKPVSVTDEVTRATVGQTWAHIEGDLLKAIAGFEAVGGDRGDLFYWGYASSCGLMARVELYLEKYTEAKKYAGMALDAAGITELTYTPAGYKALYNGGNSNTESLFALAINSSNNWSANSCGTLFSTYCYGPAPKLVAMYGENDVRKAIMGYAPGSTDIKPLYAAGKFAAYASGNPAFGTNYIINAPEMFLIQAEADLKAGSLNDAKDELFVVARRNLDLTKDDLGSSVAEVFAFLKDERARELFQEGHRLWDLRRWDEKASFFATSAPAVSYTFNNVDAGNIVFPIPVDEINTKSGVVQNPDWFESQPK